MIRISYVPKLNVAATIFGDKASLSHPTFSKVVVDLLLDVLKHPSSEEKIRAIVKPHFTLF